MSTTVQIVNEKTDLVKSAPLSSLGAVAVTGAGATQNWGAVRANHALQVTLTGGPSAANVNLEGSLDGVTWTTIGSWSLAGGQTSGQTVWFTGKAALYTRANLTTLTGGAAPTVTAIIGAA